MGSGVHDSWWMPQFWKIVKLKDANEWVVYILQAILFFFLNFFICFIFYFLPRCSSHMRVFLLCEVTAFTTLIVEKVECCCKLFSRGSGGFHQKSICCVFSVEQNANLLLKCSEMSCHPHKWCLLWKCKIPVGSWRVSALGEYFRVKSYAAHPYICNLNWFNIERPACSTHALFVLAWAIKHNLSMLHMLVIKMLKTAYVENLHIFLSWVWGCAAFSRIGAVKDWKWSLCPRGMAVNCASIIAS